jgi:hypothetical protein
MTLRERFRASRQEVAGGGPGGDGSDLTRLREEAGALTSSARQAISKVLHGDSESYLEKVAQGGGE